MEALNRILADWPFVPLAPVPAGVAPSGRLRQPVAALLLDVYGTLLVSAGGDIAATGAQRPPLRIGQQPPAGMGGGMWPTELQDRLHRRIVEIHRQLQAQGIDVPEVRIEQIWLDLLGTDDTVLARQSALTYELGVNPVWPMPGAAELLAACRRHKIILGLVSNAQFYTPMTIEQLFGNSLDELGFAPGLRIFSYCFHRSKPSPVLFEAARDGLQALGIVPESALYLGNDMLNDVWAAHRAGFQTALFAGDARSLRLRGEDPRCADLTPDLVVTDLNRLADLLVRTRQAD